MRLTLDITVSPAVAESPAALREHVLAELAPEMRPRATFRIVKRSIDARGRRVKINLRIQVFLDETPPDRFERRQLRDVSSARPVIIVGTGPAGLFAALRLVDLGLRPILFERGKDVRSRRRDVAAIHKEHLVDPDSNYCFGEGGAGTFSDGKLYTRSTKRGDVARVLETFVTYGASEDILIDAHPHIGTNKLPQIIINMRNALLEAGAEIRFQSRVTELWIENGAVRGVRARQAGHEIDGRADDVILATGHSARDMFELLHAAGLRIEAKPFAMGVRVEHAQTLIDSLQYHCRVDEVPRVRKHLPAASYSVVHQVDGRGVYSFCMCPGGIIAPCATSTGEVVTNGWSPSKRNNPWANSGIVVPVEPVDFEELQNHGPLAGLRYQQAIEHLACEAAGGRQTAPAQRLTDFCEGKLSKSLPASSYPPGIRSVALHELLPPAMVKRLQEGFRVFGAKMKGYYTSEAVVHAVESRTSSPVRIPRDTDSLQHPDVRGLYPCGEGAGYAGGIVSAAIDGERCAQAIGRN